MNTLYSSRHALNITADLMLQVLYNVNGYLQRAYYDDVLQVNGAENQI